MGIGENTVATPDKNGSFLKTLGQFAAEVVIITLLVMAMRVAAEGMYLPGLPEAEEISSVTFSSRSSGHTRELTSPEDIDLALRLTGFLKYDLFKEPADVRTPYTLTLHLKTGDEITIKAGEDAVLYKDKLRAVKKPGQFSKFADGLFFSPQPREDRE